MNISSDQYPKGGGSYVTPKEIVESHITSKPIAPTSQMKFIFCRCGDVGRRSVCNNVGIVSFKTCIPSLNNRNYQR